MSDRVEIGKIVAAHGIKGEVRVLPWSDSPERFSLLHEVFLRKGEVVRPVHIISARPHKNVVVLGLQEITGASEAEAVKDWTVEIEHKDLLPLPGGRYYIFQLIGLKVFKVDGTPLGVLTDVLQTGANDVYVVKSPEGREFLIPALKSVVKKVDTGNREMLVEPMPGLLE